MEQLIRDIEQFAKAHDTTPEKVVRAAIAAKPAQWTAWVAGTSSPTMRNADRIRAYMAQVDARGAGPRPAQRQEASSVV